MFKEHFHHFWIFVALSNVERIARLVFLNFGSMFKEHFHHFWISVAYSNVERIARLLFDDVPTIFKNSFHHFMISILKSQTERMFSILIFFHRCPILQQNCSTECLLLYQRGDECCLSKQGAGSNGGQFLLLPAGYCKYLLDFGSSFLILIVVQDGENGWSMNDRREVCSEEAGEDGTLEHPTAGLGDSKEVFITCHLLEKKRGD